MAKITKEDLPVEVVEYIDALETHTEQIEAELEKSVAAVVSVTKERDDLAAKVTTSDIEKGDGDFAVLLEKADPAVRAILTKQKADLATQAEKIAKAEDAALTGSMIAKAANLPMISESKNELGDILKTAFGVSVEFGEKVESLLKAANNQIASANLFGAIGTAGGSSTISSSVETIASELRKGDPSLTNEQAISRAFDQNPALYGEYMAEQKG